MSTSETFTINDAKPELKTKPDRPPRGSAAPKASTAPSVSKTAITADVRKAMATLESGYNLIATGLLVLGLPDTANEWIESAEQLKATNEDALTASPKLAKAIANAGGTGGAATFFITHGLAVAGVVRIGAKEMRSKRLGDEEATEYAGMDIPKHSSDRDPTLIPGM